MDTQQLELDNQTATKPRATRRDKGTTKTPPRSAEVIMAGIDERLLSMRDQCKEHESFPHVVRMTELVAELRRAVERGGGK